MHKASFRFWLLFGILMIINILTPGVISMLLNGQITDENNMPIDTQISNVIAFLIFCVFMCYLISAVFMLWQYFAHKASILTISDKGVENTVIIFVFLAFVFVLPVKLIPWEAVTHYDSDDKPLIRVDKTKLQACGIAKFLLGIVEYNFLNTFCSPKVTTDEIDKYKDRFSIDRHTGD